MPILSGTITASSDQSGYEATKAGDLNFTETRWAASDSSLPQWLQWDVGSAQSIDYYVVAPSSFSSTQNPTAWELRGSNDATFATYTVIDSRSGVSFASANGHYYDLGSPSAAFRYYRLHITGNGGATTSLLEFEIGSLSGTFTPYSTFTPVANGGGGYTLGVVHEFLADGDVNGVRYWQTAAMSGTTKLTLYDTTGAVVGSTTQAATGTAEWRTATLASPLAVTAGDLLMPTVYNAGDFARVSTATLLTFDNFFGPVRVVAHAAETFHGSTNNPRYTNADAEPGSFFNAAPYAVTVEFAAAVSAVTVAAPLLSLAVDVLNPTVTAAAPGVTVSAPALPLALDVLDPTVTSVTPQTVAAPVVTLGIDVLNPTVTTASQVTVAAPVLSLAVDVLDPTVTAAAPAFTIDAPVLSVAIDVRNPTVTTATEGEVDLDASVDLQVLDVESQTIVEQGADVVHLSAGVGLEVVLQLTPDTPPLGVLTEYPIRRNSHQMPALTAASPRYAPGDYPVVSEDYGQMHWFVDGVDVTYKRGVPMSGDYSTAVPFGSVSASLSAPQQRPWDIPGEGDWAEFDLSRDPELDVVVVRADDSLDYKWEGYLARETDASGPGRMEYTYSAEGLFMQAASTIFDPPVIQNPIDPGWYIADLLNSVPHRRWTKIPRFTTGLPPVVDRGETGITVWQRVQNVLAKCIAADLRQLTIVRVARRTYRIQWKQPVTVDQWTVTKGAPGVSMDLSRDQSTRYDAIYGRGVALDGGAWGNFYFPGLEFYTIPDFPRAGLAPMHAGDSDADTTTGRGVTDWQRRMRFIGYPVSLDGVLDSADLSWMHRIQRAADILEDDALGPQTWAATFNPGQYEENLKRVRLPLASVDGAEPWLYSATGANLGPNPQDEPWRVVRSIEVDFGNMDKADAFPLAERMLDLLKDPAWVGTITLLTDPHEGSRFDIDPGDNVTPVGHRDEPNLQVAEVRADGLEVSLTVDSIGRDILAVDAILQRDRDARRDPTGRVIGNDMLRLNKSEVVEYESESKAGFFPRTAVNGNFGLWTVLPIFVSQIGVAKVEFTTSPKAEIVVALCSRPITANRLASLVPDPLSSSDGWYDNVETLKEKYGVLEVFGTPDSPGGYWPRQKGGGSLTGVLKDTSSLLYNSAYGGFVWVAVYTSRSTYVEGRVYPATAR